jgi:hypothetical protein
MDLLDFWKCHVCQHAQYLFLLVPVALRQNPTMSPRNEFAPSLDGWRGSLLRAHTRTSAGCACSGTRTSPTHAS